MGRGSILFRLEIPKSLPNFAKLDRGAVYLDKLGEPDVKYN